MKAKTIYIAEDGAQFDTEKEAILHEMNSKNKDVLAAEKYLKNSYYGKQLAEKYNRELVGTWQIYGEDPNCDMGGYHHTPYLDTVHGTMFDAVKYAIQLKRFYTWGGGGEIKYVEVKSV